MTIQTRIETAIVEHLKSRVPALGDRVYRFVRDAQSASGPVAIVQIGAEQIDYERDSDGANDRVQERAMVVEVELVDIGELSVVRDRARETSADIQAALSDLDALNEILRRPGEPDQPLLALDAAAVTPSAETSRDAGVRFGILHAYSVLCRTVESNPREFV